MNLVPNHPSVDRVIVNRQEQSLFRKVLGELRSLDVRTRVMDIPHNLQYINIQATKECQASRIWTSKYTSFGDSRNMEPINSSKSTSANNSDVGIEGDAGAARITAWTKDIDPSANPEVAADAPVEPPAPTRRRVKAESDSDDDEPAPRPMKIAPAIAPTTVPAAPLVQLLDGETLRSDKKQPSFPTEAPSSSLHYGQNDIMSDILEEEDVIANDSAQAPQPLLVGVEHVTEVVSTKHSTPLRASSAKHQTKNLHAPLPEYAARSKPMEPEDLGLTETFLDSQAGNQAESPQPPQPPLSPKEAVPTGSQPPTVERPVFDPNAYRSSPRPARGEARGGQQRGRANNRQTKGSRAGNRGGRGHSHGAQPSPDATRTSARGSHRGGLHTGPRISQSVGRRGFAPQQTPDSLIDVRTPVTNNGAAAIPPGFESIVPLVPESRAPAIPPGLEPLKTNQSTVASQHITQQSQIAGASLSTSTPSRLRERPNATSPASTSGRSRNSRMRFSDEGSEYVTTFIPKKDQTSLREKSLQDAMAAVAEMAGQNKKAKEEEPPRLHSTMHQQAGNPGKKTSVKKQETKEEAAARRRRALEEAYGPTPSAASPRPVSPKLEDMSKWKQKQLKNNTPLAEAHPQIVGDSLRERESLKLLSMLQPVFETGRAFKGTLMFEIQLGQVLVTPGQELRDRAYHSIDNWNTQLAGSSHTFSTFTKILTSNGADIDRTLELKGSEGDIKLWNSTPCLQSVTYEFQCQSRSNEDFQIIVDESGGYVLRKGLVNIGTVNIHVPAQIWDLSATLSGPLQWLDPPDTISQSAQDFVKSLYVLPDRRKLILYFRPPHDREMKIRNLIVRRVSYHQATRKDGRDVLLKVTEAKSLQFRVHANDKSLWVAYETIPKNETEYKSQLADAGRIHYELSIVHSGINDVLAGNESLEIGELTTTAGKTILDRNTIRVLLDSAIQLVSKVDFIGMWNYGTRRRLYDEERQRQAKLMADLGPRARTIAPSASITGGSRMPTTSGSTSGGLTTTQLPIPGVRMGTEAEIREDESGQYYYGMGGARIPMPESLQKALNSAATVVPDDSASNAGRGLHFVGARLEPRGSGFW